MTGLDRVFWILVYLAIIATINMIIYVNFISSH
jgi:hypothetical protein